MSTRQLTGRSGGALREEARRARRHALDGRVHSRDIFGVNAAVGAGDRLDLVERRAQRRRLGARRLSVRGTMSTNQAARYV